MNSRFTSVGLLALIVFALCLVFNFQDNLKFFSNKELLADNRLKREIRPFANNNNNDNNDLSLRRKRASIDETKDVVVLKDNPFTDKSNQDAKSAQHYQQPYGYGGHQHAYTAVYTRVVQPALPIQPVLQHPHVGYPISSYPDPGFIGETRRDRLRRVLRKLLGERKEIPVAVPVPVPVAAGVPGEDAVHALDSSSFEGSYVAVSGRPGERTVHVVNGHNGVNFAGTIAGPHPGYIGGRRKRPFLKSNNNDNFNHSPEDYNGDDFDYGDYGYDYADGTPGPGYDGRRNPLGGDLSPGSGFLGRGRNRRIPPVPRCSYINTDFAGDDVGDGGGLTSASAQECKSTCQREEFCQFWTYRPGWARGCYLKRGRRGDPTPLNAIPKEGFISGTKLDTCLCLQNSVNEEEQVCPVKATQYVYPWHRKRPNGYDGNVRFDYDDTDIRRRPAIDDGLVPIEPVTLPPPVGIGGTVNTGRKNRARTRAGLQEGTPLPVETDKNKEVEVL